MERRRRTELLGAEEVAGLVGVKESTVWRWCREGSLPCLKVGKHWRVRPEALENFLRKGERPVTLVEQLGSFLRVPDNVLAIARNRDVMRRLDAAFFRVGEAHDGLLVKFYAEEGESEDELLARFEENGLEAGRLRSEGRLLMRPEEISSEGHGDQLGRLVEEEAGGGRTVWASFDWFVDVDLDTALEQQVKLTELVDARQLVVNTATIEEAIEGWSPAVLRQAQSLHSGTILASESVLWLARATPMPQA
jgi:excisionase family DNA binding protein